MKEPGFLLEAGVAGATLGMALIALGVIISPFLYPGLLVVTAGLLASAVAGIWYVVPRKDHVQPT
jgi:hypothetical protein